MKQLQEIYRPNDIQAIEEARHKLGALRMIVDQNPSILFYQLATLEHAYAHLCYVQLVLITKILHKRSQV